MASGDVMRVALSGVLGSEPVMVTFGLVEGAGGPGTNPLANCAAAVEAALGGAGADITGFSEQWFINQILVGDVQPGTRPQFKLACSHLGTETDPHPMPPFVTINIQWQTDLKATRTGPKNRGRMYLPGGISTTQNSGFWTADMIDPASGFASLLFDQFVTDGTDYQLNLLSYVPGSHPRALRAATPITSFTIDNIVRDQRRREVGVRISRG